MIKVLLLGKQRTNAIYTYDIMLTDWEILLIVDIVFYKELILTSMYSSQYPEIGQSTNTQAFIH